MFISDALAGVGGASSAQDIMSIVIQLGLIFLIFYLLLIRPQQKKLKEHNEMLMAIKPGDKVVTGGGIYAKVKKVDGTYMTVEIANGIDVVVSRMTVREVVSEDAASEKKTKVVSKPEKKAKDKGNKK